MSEPRPFLHFFGLGKKEAASAATFLKDIRKTAPKATKAAKKLQKTESQGQKLAQKGKDTSKNVEKHADRTNTYQTAQSDLAAAEGSYLKSVKDKEEQLFNEYTEKINATQDSYEKELLEARFFKEHENLYKKVSRDTKKIERSLSEQQLENFFTEGVLKEGADFRKAFRDGLSSEARAKFDNIGKKLDQSIATASSQEEMGAMLNTANDEIASLAKEAHISEEVAKKAFWGGRVIKWTANKSIGAIGCAWTKKGLLLKATGGTAVLGVLVPTGYSVWKVGEGIIDIGQAIGNKLNALADWLSPSDGGTETSNNTQQAGFNFNNPNLIGGLAGALGITAGYNIVKGMLLSKKEKAGEETWATTSKKVIAWIAGGTLGLLSFGMTKKIWEDQQARKAEEAQRGTPSENPPQTPTTSQSDNASANIVPQGQNTQPSVNAASSLGAVSNTPNTTRTTPDKQNDRP